MLHLSVSYLQKEKKKAETSKKGEHNSKMGQRQSIKAEKGKSIKKGGGDRKCKEKKEKGSGHSIKRGKRIIKEQRKKKVQKERKGGKGKQEEKKGKGKSKKEKKKGC